MQDYPHIYSVSTRGGTSGPVRLDSPGLETINTAPPREFGGPGDQWSPETLMIGAVADCYILSFRAVAQAKKYTWIDIECDVEGVLERPDRLPHFTRLNIRARLTVENGSDIELAEKLLQRAKDICLITNSMVAEKTLETQIIATASGS